MLMKKEPISGMSSPQGVSIDTIPNLSPFQSISRSESVVDEDLAYAKQEGLPKSPTTDTVQWWCEIGFGNEVPEEVQIYTVINTVFDLVSNLMEVVVEMKETKIQDDELSTGKLNASIKKADSSDSVSIPPEIDMLHLETDLLLNSIRMGMPLNWFSESPINRNIEGVEDTLNQKRYNFDELEDSDVPHKSREEEDNVLNRKL